MTLYDFLMLDPVEQTTKVMVTGTLITHLHLRTSSFALYAVHTFFVELEYLKESSKSKQESILIKKRIFSSNASYMEKYLGNYLFV